MTLKKGLCLLLLLGSLSSSGCAGLPRVHQEKEKPPEVPLTKEEQEAKYNDDLARELRLYGD